MRRILAGLLLSGLLLTVAAPIVAAHECVIANRAAQGDAGADHSGNWERLTLADIFGFIHGVVGGPALTADQIEDAVEIAVDQGLPVDGWLTRGDKTIGDPTKNPNLADGKGLDHLSIVYGEQIVGIYFQVLGAS
jgi:hypothetical protein